MKRLSFAIFISVLLSAFNSLAQPFEIGHWRDHLPYIHARLIVDAGSKIFCSTDDGFYSYTPGENEIVRLSKLNGLSDFGISDISYSSAYHKLVIAYNNTNVDLLSDDMSVINISDIKRKNIPGNKRINNVTVDGRNAYLACGFGIVVVDLQRNEIKDTYYVGPSGLSEVYEVAFDATYLFAAAEDGVYRIEKANSNPANFNAWTKILDDTGDQGFFKNAVVHNNILLVSYSRSAGDSIMAYDGNWGYALPLELQSISQKYNLAEINSSLVVSESFAVSVFDNSFNRIKYIDGSVVLGPDFRDGIIDASQKVWVADHNKGLIKVDNSLLSYYNPDGPYSSASNDIQIQNNVLWVSHGPKNRGWKNNYAYLGFSRFSGSDWTTFDGYSASTPLFNQYNFYDNVSLIIDPSDVNHIFVGATGPGLLEFKYDAANQNGSPLKFYRDTNSTLIQQIGNPGQVKVHGMALDENRNLWVSNAGTPTVINVLKNNGQWKAFSFPGAVNANTFCGQLIIDQNGYKWLSVFENIGGKEGVLVYNDNQTIDNTSDDQFEIVDFGSNRVRVIKMDNEGTIWTGTDQGVYIFYPPSLTPQQILIKQDNAYQYLLATDVVTVIAIDGANRKWIGTESSGVYLLSADGQDQIKHFTTENSPLFSDNITALAINDETGEVFIGTEKGIISYQGDAIGGGESCGDLLVYPNPVKHDYEGTIAVKGVIPNGTVKVTDISGGLVFEGKSVGAQAVWDGRNLSGQKVQTGVYIVYSSDATGEQKCTTKLMIYR
ncbi:MAG TPA: hypothetical protein PLD36_00430 [Bacteroidia bacterium]|jgi:streptogramin lyase|nr:hypothetical protein [Bacteroidia bacterium]